MDGRLPYMYLPALTCDAIAAYLPMTYDASLALYIWDTNNPAYRDIVSSPTHLSFVFNSGTSITNATIKIPFALLNLALLPPIVDTPTVYFPCRPTGALDSNPLTSYWLGRAFLQQAFLATDWRGNRLWLAQAPGPNLPATNAVQTNLLEPLQTSTTAWEDTWEGHLVPLSSTSSLVSSRPSSTDPAGNTSSGISTRPRITIGVCVSVGVLLVALGIALLIRHSHRNRRRTGAHPDPPDWQRKELDTNTSIVGPSAQQSCVPMKPELEDGMCTVGGTGHELNRRTDQLDGFRYELGDGRPVQELPGIQVPTEKH